MELKVSDRIEGVSAFSRRIVETLGAERAIWRIPNDGLKIRGENLLPYIPTGTMLYCVLNEKLTQVCIKEIHYYANGEHEEANTKVVVETPAGKTWTILIQDKYGIRQQAFFESKEQYLRFATGDSNAHYHIKEVDLTELIDFSNQPGFRVWHRAFSVSAYGASYVYKWEDGRIKERVLSFGRIVIVGDTAYGEITPYADDIYIDKAELIKEKLGDMEVEEFPSESVTYKVEVKITRVGEPIVSRLLE